MADTNYHVNVLYDVTDRASKALEGIEKNAKRAADGTQSLKGSLMALGGGLIGGRVLGAAGKALFGFNEQMANSKIVMAGMLSLNTGAKWEASMNRATKSVERFQEMARTSALTTADLVDMSTRIERPLLQAGLGMRDIEDVTFGAANAAKAFGIEAGMAALDIDQALRGTLSARDRFVPALLKQKGIGKKGQGYSNAEWNAMAKSDPSKAAAELTKAFNSPIIKKMAEAQSQTLGGAWSTFKDTIEIGLGRVGMPIFKAVTAEIQRWNKWLDANKKKVDEFGKKVADGLVTGFRAVQSAATFVVNNADILIRIAKAWAMVKVANVGIAAASSGANVVGMLGSRVGKQPAGFKGSSISGAAAAGPVAMAAAAGWQVGSWINDHIVGTSIADGLASVFKSEAQAQEEEYRKILVSKRRLAKAIDEATQRYANEKGSKRATPYASLAGAVSLRRAEYNADVALMKAGGDPLLAALGKSAPILNREGRRNFDEAKARAFESKSKLMRGENVMSLAPMLADTGIESVMKELTKAQRAGVDMEGATNAVMAELIRTMQLGGPFAWLGLSKEKLKEIIAANSLDGDLFKGGRKPSSTNVNIAKVEVAAKDPDRWIAELDARVSRMVRAPRAARTRQRGR